MSVPKRLLLHHHARPARRRPGRHRAAHHRRRGGRRRVTAVDVVESHHDRMVVDLTCNARGTDHAEQVAKAVDRLQGVETRKVSDRNLSFLHFHEDAAEMEGAA